MDTPTLVESDVRWHTRRKVGLGTRLCLGSQRVLRSQLISDGTAAYSSHA